MLANNVDSFRDTMNAAAIPSSVSNNGTGDQHAFMKELEKKSNQIDQKDSIDTTRQSEPPKNSKTDEPRSEKTEKNHTEKTENRPQHPDRDSEARETPGKTGDKRVENKSSHPQVKENVKNGDSSGEMNTVKTARIPKIGKTGNSGGTESAGKTEHNPKEVIKNVKIGNIKEIIQKHQVQSEKLEEAKEDVKEKFSEAQRIKSGNTAEKVVLKDLVGGKETSKTTPDIEVENVRKNEPSNAEKQQMKGPEVDKKDNPSSFKNELNTAKNKANPDGTFNVGTVNTREAQPVKTEIKIQKLLLRQNIREQYEAVKNNVLNSVDNGIKMMLSQGESRVSIKLHPPELGKIQVELIVKDNHVSARINTETAAVKEVIMANLGQLKSNIENAGISVQRFDVEVGGFRNHFDGRSSDDASGGNGRGKKEDLELQLPGDPDWLPDKIIRQASYSYFIGRRINYLV